MIKTCKTCVFFANAGECRRRAPAPVHGQQEGLIAALYAVTEVLIAAYPPDKKIPGVWGAAREDADNMPEFRKPGWPWVDEGDWCGEWQGE
jgi:hypothetical protein